MVNAQQWLNEKFPTQESKDKVRELHISSAWGIDNINQSRGLYSFCDTQLEGELYLGKFNRLESLHIVGDITDTSRYQKLSKLSIQYWLTTLVLHDFSEKIEINLPLLLRIGRRGSEELEQHPQMPQPVFRELDNLSIKNCPQFTVSNNAFSYSNSPKLLRGLNRLVISNCPSLTELDLTDNRKLTHLDCSFNNNLETIKNLEKVVDLAALNVVDCPSLTSLTGIANLTNLKVLEISNCGKLRVVDSLSKLTELIRIDFSSCPLVISRPLSFSENQQVLIQKQERQIQDQVREIQEQREEIWSVDRKIDNRTKELFNIVMPNGDFSFARLKEEIIKLKINDLTTQIRKKKWGLEELVDIACTVVKSADVQSLLKVQKEIIEQKKENDRGAKVELELYQHYIYKLGEEEIQKLCQAQIELTKLEEQSKKLQQVLEEQARIQVVSNFRKT